MISIGAIYGGPEAKFFDDALRAFMQHCEHHADWEEEDVTVNIVYHLPGSVWKPDHIEVRTAKFSKKDRILMIQIGVEEELIASRDQFEVDDYIIDTADEAIGLAKSKFDSAKIDYDLDADRRFLYRWRDETLRANKAE